MTDHPIGTALITGAGKRIGRALALGLAEHGFDIGVHYNTSADDAEEVAKQIQSGGRKAFALGADLFDESAVSALMDNARDALGPINLLINSASTFENDDLEDFTTESWNTHFNVNLFAPIKLAQAFAAQIDKKANNLVINITDQRTRKLTPQFFTYTLSKSALQSATITMAQALGPKAIRVNAIAPGPTLKNWRQSDDDWAAQQAATVLGVGASPEDILAGVMYLHSAHSVTGETITIDGGQNLAWQTPDVMVKE